LIRVVQFLNQIQAGLGGEERMDIEPMVQTGAVGMGMLLRTMLLGNGADIVGTVICGDNYFLENRENAISILVDMIEALHADVVICGPALNHKRYGECCGYLAEYLVNQAGIPAFGAMSRENTGTELFRKRIYIIETPKVGGTGLNSSLRRISGFAVKLSKGEAIGTGEEEGYFPRS